MTTPVTKGSQWNRTSVSYDGNQWHNVIHNFPPMCGVTLEQLYNEFVFREGNSTTTQFVKWVQKKGYPYMIMTEEKFNDLMPSDELKRDTQQPGQLSII